MRLPSRENALHCSRRFSHSPHTRRRVLIRLCLRVSRAFMCRRRRCTHIIIMFCLRCDTQHFSIAHRSCARWSTSMSTYSPSNIIIIMHRMIVIYFGFVLIYCVYASTKHNDQSHNNRSDMCAFVCAEFMRQINRCAQLKIGPEMIWPKANSIENDRTFNWKIL